MIEKGILFATGPGAADRLTANGQPFSCLPIANRPLVHHALEQLGEAGAHSIAIVTDAATEADLRQAVASMPVAAEIVWLGREPDQNGTGLGERARDFVDGQSCIVHLGDSLIRTSLLLILSSFRGGRYECLELVRSGREQSQITNLFAGREGANGQPRNERLGVCVLGPGFADSDIEWTANGSMDSVLESVIRGMLDNGGARNVARIPESWRYHPSPKWILEANRFALRSLTSRRPQGELTETDVEGVVDIHPTATLESSIVRGPAVIGAGTHIKDSYIGPNCSIGDDVEIEGSEVEDSVILSGASVRHLGNRLEASVIGPGARVHREFRLPRGLRLNVGRKAEVSLS